MCVIVYKPEGKALPSMADLRRCFEANPDGAGFMWPAGGWVHIRKGFMDWDGFYKAISKRDFTGVPLVIHFRITTQGGVQEGLTHPFPVTGEYGAMRSLMQKARCGLAHNGVIALTSDGARDHSDTMRFVKDFAHPLLKAKGFWDPDGTISQGLGKIAYGSRLAIMTADGSVRLTGEWHERADGCMYSNLYAFPKELYSFDKWGGWHGGRRWKKQ